MNVIVTAGPTVESIDEVMKITNMSSGALGVRILNTLLCQCDNINMIFYLVNGKHAIVPSIPDKFKDKVTVVSDIDNTNELLLALRLLLKQNKIDAVIHSAAVGDYKTDFTSTLELMCNNVTNTILREVFCDNESIDYYHRYSHLHDLIFDTLCSSKIDNSAKISSMEPNLVVKLGLTPKIINQIKDISPETILIGFKLLDKVSEEILYEAAQNIILKAKADYVVANDLSMITATTHPAMIISSDGIHSRCENKDEIAFSISNIIKNIKK